MAQPKLTPQQFIKNSFTPQIGVLCTKGAEQLCSKNNLTFIELLQPFCRLNCELHYKDSNGTSVSLRSLKITLIDVYAKPTQTTLARKLLNSSVSECNCTQLRSVFVAEHRIEIPMNVSWFEAWRETFFEVQYPADHEFIKHLLGCIVVMSTLDPDPLKELENLKQTLQQLQNTLINRLPKWFNNNILTYFVLIHENTNPDSNIQNDTYDKIKSNVGTSNCFLLQINSRTLDSQDNHLADPWSQFISSKKKYTSSEESDTIPQTINSKKEQKSNENSNTCTVFHPLSPESEKNHLVNIASKESIKPNTVLHGACLSTQDVEEIKHLVNDFAVRSLMPYVERQIQQLSDLVANKKGVSKSLFSATKRWFIPNKPTSNSATINTLTYPSDAPELQIRRLGDLYFMFGHYSMAYQAYHMAKRDFSADQAWLYLAGALEMAALAAFMANESSRKSFDYMEESIVTYLTICKMPQFATKATLLSAECLMGQNMYGEAAHQFIRMTNEDSDLRSALLLEQAAYCFLQCSRPNMVRKYAFHMVMAGHRFNKAAQRRHSLRCYKQAYEIYKRKGWNLAEDHILSSIGRLANSLDELEIALSSYAKLLTEESKQTPQQQEAYLKEYLSINIDLFKKETNLPTPLLPMPVILNETIKVLVGPAPPLRTPGKVPALGTVLNYNESEKDRQKWHKLEELLVQEAQGSVPMVFKPLVTLFTGLDVSNNKPLAVIGEPIQLAVELYNPLQIMLNLKDIYLLWHIENGESKFSVDEVALQNTDDIMKTVHVKSLVIQANSKQEVVLSITPLSVGDVFIKGICYSIVGTESEISLRGKQVFDIKAPKLKQSVAERQLQLKVVPSTACLQVSFSEMNTELLRNEFQKVNVEVRNVGSVPLHKIYFASSTPHLISSRDFKQDTSLNTGEVANREKEARKNHVFSLPALNVLESGQHCSMEIWIKAPDEVGPSFIDLLIYYENVNSSSLPKYRLVRHVWPLSIQESLKVDASAFQSHNSKDVEQLALVIHATNLNKIHHAILTEIHLLSASLLSCNWQLCSESTIPAKNVRLESQASYYLFLKIKRLLAKGDGHTEVSFTDSKSLGPDASKIALDFARRCCDPMKVNIFDNDFKHLQSRRKQDALLILRWQASVTDSSGRHRTVFGQNQIPLQVPSQDQPINNNNITSSSDKLSLDKTTMRNAVDTLPLIQTSATQRLDKQVTCNLTHKSNIKHNFKEDKMCVVPVKLLMHSVAKVPMVIKIVTGGTSCPSQVLSTKSSVVHPNCSEQFRWIKVASASKQIEPLSSIEVNMFVVVSNPGTFDLGSRLEIWCHPLENSKNLVRQTCSVQSSLIIMNC